MRNSLKHLTPATPLIPLFVLTFALTACGGGGGSSDTNEEATDQVGTGTEEETVGDPSPIPPVEEPPEDPPVEDPPVEDPPVEDPPVEDPPVEDPPVEDPPVEDPPVEDPPVEDPPVEETPPVVSSKPVFGLYSLDGAAGTYRDANIRDYDFIEGYAWRISWSDLEVADGVYDFSAFDHIINELGAIDQKLSWLLMSDLPTFLSSDPNIDTYMDGSVLKPSPWDPDLQAKFGRFVRALAAHQIPDPAANNELVALRDHSVLSILHPSFPGLPRGAIRNGDDTNVADVPGYSREKLAQVIDYTLTLWREEFPAHPLLLSIWPIHDDNRQEPMWEFARNEFAKVSNVGVFQDNLQASKACSTCALDVGPPDEGMGAPLLTDQLWVGFQMLGSWFNPSPSHADNLVNGTPDEGIDFAVDVYSSYYYEVYTDDLDNAAWQPTFRAWNEQLRNRASQKLEALKAQP